MKIIKAKYFRLKKKKTLIKSYIIEICLLVLAILIIYG